jgi:hypothetical protein
MRHLISGDDWAIAGEATAEMAAPVADTFKKSRRFIQALLIAGVFPEIGLMILTVRTARTRSLPPVAISRRRSNMDASLRKRDQSRGGSH